MSKDVTLCLRFFDTIHTPPVGVSMFVFRSFFIPFSDPHYISDLCGSYLEWCEVDPFWITLCFASRLVRGAR